MSDLGGGHSIESVYSAADIATRLAALAAEIASRKPSNLLVVPILTGSFVFAADLIRALNGVGLHPEVDFLALSSYRKSRISSGQVTILRDLDLHVEGRHVLLVDDVLDSGRTLAFAKDLIAARGARIIETCVLLAKDVSRAVNIQADYAAFACPDVYVVGYGMDVAHRYRELPYVGRIVD
mgnify:CR=1 FL=1